MLTLRSAAGILLLSAAGAAACSETPSIPRDDVGPGVFFVEMQNDTALPSSEPAPRPGCDPLRKYGGYLAFEADGTVTGILGQWRYYCPSGSRSAQYYGGFGVYGPYQVSGSTLAITNAHAAPYAGTLSGNGIRASTTIDLVAGDVRARLRRESDAGEAVRRILMIQGYWDVPYTARGNAVFFLDAVNGAAPPYPFADSSPYGPASIADGYMLLAGDGHAVYNLKLTVANPPVAGMPSLFAYGVHHDSGSAFAIGDNAGSTFATGRVNGASPDRADSAWVEFPARNWLSFSVLRDTLHLRLRRERDATAAVSHMWRIERLP